VVVTSLIVAIGVAVLSYRFIEAPSIRVGRFAACNLSEMLRDRVVRAPAARGAVPVTALDALPQQLFR
jgi:peptidoglycan/LPS O-acetylase OafA/YrhL